MAEPVLNVLKPVLAQDPHLKSEHDFLLQHLHNTQQQLLGEHHARLSVMKALADVQAERDHFRGAFEQQVRQGQSAIEQAESLRAAVARFEQECSALLELLNESQLALELCRAECQRLRTEAALAANTMRWATRLLLVLRES